MGSNGNELLTSLVDLLPEINGDSVELELDPAELETAVSRIFSR